MSSTAMPVLAVEDLNIALALSGQRVPMVTDLSLTVKAGEAVALVGESGCGKSMTARVIIGLLPADVTATGSVQLDGAELMVLSPRERRRICGRRIGFIFQEPMTALHPTLTIGRQMTDGLRLHLGLSRRGAQDRAAELLDRVGIPHPRHVLDGYAHQLSGGMRQRVMIAMAISCGPRLVIADEPTTALDVTIQGQVLDLLAGMREEFGLAMLYITHDLEVVRAFCDRAVVMYAGDVVESGEVAAVIGAPCHPYTAGLMAAIPRFGESRNRLTTIPGQVPPLGSWPPGCRFAPRCSHANEDCAKRPLLAAAGFRCWHPLGPVA
jgi:oligopeptide/dipeptide ABC transporter ATP-binding protein